MIFINQSSQAELLIACGLSSLPDHVASRCKRKLNFSDFRFGVSALAFERSTCEGFLCINRTCIEPETAGAPRTCCSTQPGRSRRCHADAKPTPCVQCLI